MNKKTNRIGICGTQSIGKTTLVEALSVLPEFKDYVGVTERSKYLRDLGIPLNTDSTLIGQTIFLAERCTELLQPNIITDRTIIDVMAFTQSAKSINSLDKAEFIRYASLFLQEYDFIFYISPDGLDIEDNNVREINEFYRADIDNKIQLLLSEFRYKIKNLHTISGSTSDRISQIKHIISF